MMPQVKLRSHSSVVADTIHGLIEPSNLNNIYFFSLEDVVRLREASLEPVFVLLHLYTFKPSHSLACTEDLE